MIKRNHSYLDHQTNLTAKLKCNHILQVISIVRLHFLSLWPDRNMISLSLIDIGTESLAKIFITSIVLHIPDQIFGQ
jgi:hypothetical protein